MRTIEVKGKKFDASNQLICVPLLSENLESMSDELERCMASNPDVIEWRGDYFKDILDSAQLSRALELFRPYHHSVPLIFTFRSVKEGGQNECCDDDRSRVIQSVIQSRLFDFIDVELNSEAGFLLEIQKSCEGNICKMVVSHHDFEKTPTEEEMLQSAQKAKMMGADLLKLAYMANDSSDVLRMFKVNQTVQISEDLQMIGICMGEIGKISRVIGYQFGSAMTYASIVGTTAPGQMSIEKIRRIRSLL